MFIVMWEEPDGYEGPYWEPDVEDIREFPTLAESMAYIDGRPGFVVDLVTSRPRKGVPTRVWPENLTDLSAERLNRINGYDWFSWSKGDLVMVPPGRYFLGDPCYVLDRDTRAALHREQGARDFDLVVHHEGHTVLMFGTGGDGGCSDQFGCGYFVDSGTFGLVPDTLPWQRDAAELERLGRIVVLEQPTPAFHQWEWFVLGPYVMEF